MKNYNKLAAALLVSLSMGACTDDEKLDFPCPTKPESMAVYEYLNEYNPLKTYVDRTTDPNFKLGTGVAVENFNEKELLYRLVVSNYDEMTAGNAMKYSSCVGKDGSMDFAKVQKFVQTAQLAGLSIYGHTLCWHAQQTNEYLNGIIAPREIPIDPSLANHYLELKSTEAKSNWYDSSVSFATSEALKNDGTVYTLSFKVKASSETEKLFYTSTNGTDTEYKGYYPPIGKEWGAVSVDVTPSYDGINSFLFGFGEFSGSFYIDDIKLTAAGSDVNLIANGDFEAEDLDSWSKAGWLSHVSFAIGSEAPSTGEWIELVTNGDCEGDDMSCLYSTGPVTATLSPVGEGVNGGRAVKITTPDSPANEWDAQFFVTSDHVWKEGESYKFSMKIKASQAATIGSQAHGIPGGYIYYSMLGDMDVTTEWTTFEKEGVISASQAVNGDKDKFMQTIAFNLAKISTATTFWIDDVSFQIYKKSDGNKVELTPEEKADTLTWAMDRWIAGMMGACNGYVTSWDVVNEPLSGDDNDGDGWYDLQSAKTAKDADANFYWQDYLGDNYVRTVVKLARQYGPADMKLFINDYNLESDWDDNKKLKSLIHWIGVWESDGETKVDGIGTQMHVSCYEDAERQTRNETYVVNMFKLLAASGKLVKVSELDMGMIDKYDKKVLTSDVTFEQECRMADFYEFIVKAYFENVPAAQRYGITHWSPTDSPDDSSWRKGEPIGLWTLNYARKPAYGGFADGFKK